MATLAEGNAARAARELGPRWKVNIHIKPDETFTLGKIEDSGIIRHIWMTPVCDYRLAIFRIYYDNEENPSKVEEAIVYRGYRSKKNQRYPNCTTGSFKVRNYRLSKMENEKTIQTQGGYRTDNWTFEE